MTKGSQSVRLVPAHSATRSLKIIGDVWAMRIIWAAFQGAKRFSDWSDVVGIPRPVLVDRLNRLVSANVFEKKTYSARPLRHEYRLTVQGRELWSYLLSLWAWDQKWVADLDRHTRLLRHHRCGHDAHPVICCSACGKPVKRTDVIETRGPGAATEPALKPRWQRRPAIKTADPESRDFSNELMRIVGDRWSTQLLAAVTRGDGTFGDLQQRLHISSHVLSERLKELVEFELMERVAYHERPPRQYYKLTDKGEELLVSSWLILGWGDRWLAGPAGPPLHVEHALCGEPLRAELHCSACSGLLRPGNFSFEPDITLSVHRLAGTEA